MNTNRATFSFDGDTYSLESMLSANADDAGLCEWLRAAVCGDSFPSIAGPVVRTA